MFISYAQNFEDVVLWRAFRDLSEGTYVDVGAADPNDDSVTRAFYDRGWSGVDIEPNPEFAARLRDQRPRDVVVESCVGGSGESSVLLHLVHGTGLSTVRSEFAERIDDPSLEIEAIRVPNRSLDEILETSGLLDRPIHFLKVDVEGAEQSVLSSIDLRRWRPWVVVVEATEPRSTTVSFNAWEHFLVDAGYLFCLFDGLNRFYVAVEHEELQSVLSAPANYFDQPFRSIVESRFHDEHARVVQSWDALNRDHLSLLGSYQNLETEHLDALSNHEKLEEVYRHSLDAYSRLEQIYADAIASYQRLESTYQGLLDSYHRQDALLKEVLGE